jgi:D-arabinose 1-dehydrogenase-like Zn-dependent alcohol dehydrogenase
VAHVPDDLSAAEAAPLMCAGVTTYNCLRNSGARPGDLVAVIGLGGLGHLGVQYASRSGYNTVAIGRGNDKEALAKKLGASHYLDTATQDPAAELQKLGGAKVILATVTSADAMKAVIGGLAPTGTLMIVGAVPSLEVPALQLLLKSQQVKGWYSGTSLDSQETLGFSVLSGVRSMNESFPLDRVNEAYERMEQGKARFRAVLTIGK